MEPDDQYRRGVLADRHPHRVLAHHRGGAGLRLRDSRRRRAPDRPFAARHAGLQPDPPDRGERDDRALSAGDPRAGRRAGHERSVALRRPSLRHRRRGPGVPGRPCGRVLRGGGPRHRHRRHQGQPQRPRDLRGRVPDPPHEALSGRPAQRGPLHPPRPRTCAAPTRCSATCTPSSRAGLTGAERIGRVHGGVRHARSRGPRRRRAAAGGDRDAKGDLGASGRPLRAPGRGGRDRELP